jgi:acetyl-CoA synthetase
MQPIVWTAPNDVVERSVTARFMRQQRVETYDQLVARSIAQPEWFWDAVVEFLGIPFDPRPTRVLDAHNGLPWTRWFVDGGINLAYACVDRWAAVQRTTTAIVEEREAGAVRSLTYGQLRDEVTRATSALRAAGVGPGDRVAIYLPMTIEAVVSFLAIARAGAIAVPIFSGFGAAAVATRLADAEAKLLVTCAAFERRGRAVDVLSIVRDALRAYAVPTTFVVGDVHGEDDVIAGMRTWADALAGAPDDGALQATDAETPVLLGYTSGTTGRPKGVVHVHGGFTVKVAQEAAFQTDIQPGDVVTWVSDMGWIMGPWTIVGALANGATLALYDGAPDAPDPGRLWRFVDRHRVSILGVSPSLVRGLKAHGDAPVVASDRSSLRVFGSTGEPWDPDAWHWLFSAVGNRRVPIVNLSGGTEVGACLLSVNLLQGLKPTSLGGPALGMHVDVVDDEGRSVRGEVGELVCRAAWPAMTRGLWRDPDRYLESYWGRWPDVWVHGDWASIDDDGFWYLHGRSDDTLNIAGKRIGPAEIEAVALRHPLVTGAAAIGVPDPQKGERLVLFATAPVADEGVTAELSDAVVREFGKPFRPEVRLVGDLPRTRSAKVVRRAIKAVALGEDPGDLSTLENPEALAALPLLTRSSESESDS